MISIAIAVHNEEQNIIRCLEAVYDWVNEIIIVDGASTDKTVDIIRLFEENRLRNTSARPKIGIFNEKHEAMFHKNKQKAIERCKGEWILQLDADEVVSDELKKEILEIVNPKSEITNSKQIPNSKFQILNSVDHTAFWLPRLNYFLGKPLKKGGQYPDYTLRLYKNGVAHFPCKSVHEQVEIDMEMGGPTGGGPTQREEKRALGGTREGQAPSLIVGHLKTPLLHYPYPTFNEYLNKWTRYAVLEATMLSEKGIKPSLWNFILYMGIYPKWWFLKTYVRHKGFADGFAGFVFSLFSALRYWVTYIKLYELSRRAKSSNEDAALNQNRNIWFRGPRD